MQILLTLFNKKKDDSYLRIFHDFFKAYNYTKIRFRHEWPSLGAVDRYRVK